MAEQTIGINIHGQPIFYGTAADLAAKTAIINALAEYWLADGARYQSNGAGGWNQTHAAGGAAHVTSVTSSASALTYVTYSDATYTYYCEAAVASARSASVWQVSRKTNATGDIIYAGTGAFDQAATSLAVVGGLTYTLGA